MWRWTLHLNSGTKRSFDAAVAVGDNLYSFGGIYNLNDGDQIAVHVFNTVALRWIQLPPVTTGRGECPPEVPFNCVCHTAVLIEEVVYVWGGAVKFQIQEDGLRWIYEGHVYNVLYAFDVDTHRWIKPKVSGTVPAGRRNHSACVLGKVMYIYGGSCKTVNTNDIYKWDTTTMVWSSINNRGTPPTAPSGHSATILGTKMFVFGGWNNQVDNNNNNNIRVFDMETNCWLSTPSAKLLPERRWGHSAFAYNGELYIFGGRKQKQPFNDVWKFNPETFSWKKVEPKGEPPLGMSGVTCCMVGDRIILRGYRDTPSDLYILDLSPPLKTLCKLAVIQYGLEQSELPHDIRWELAAMTANRNR